LEAARSLIANLSPTAAATLVQIMTKSGALPKPVMSALSSISNSMQQPSSSSASSNGVNSASSISSTSVHAHAGGVVQNQLTELLGQLASLEHKNSDASAAVSQATTTSQHSESGYTV
uniref:CG32676 n=1 Tax=Anisakis simplex TaxID=6269 RepID=A0A0M3JM95_ANISI